MSHDSMTPTVVDGYAEPGSYLRPVVYNASREELEELVSRASHCDQYIKYRCYQSRLLSHTGKTGSYLYRPRPTVLSVLGCYLNSLSIN